MDALEEQIPDSWSLVKLGDFVENEKGKKPKNQQDAQDDRYCYPYVDIEAFENNIVKSYADGENCRFCSADDFLMVWDGSRSGLVGKGMDGALGSTLARINFPRILNDYAYYFLQSKYLQINSRAKGSGTPHVDPDLLWNYPFPIPPTNEQHRIVAKIEELFSELDKGIESLKTAREQLKVYRQALLKHAFEGKLTEQWRKDNADKLETADQLLERIKHEREARYQQQLEDWKAAVTQWEVEGKEGKKPRKPKNSQPFVGIINKDELMGTRNFPDGWLLTQVDSVSDILSGYAFKSKDFCSDGVPVIKIANVSYGEFVEKTQEYLPIDFLERAKEFVVSPGDVLIALTRPITNNQTKVCEYPADAPVGLLNQRVACLKNIHINEQYLLLYANSVKFREAIRSKFSETLQPNLSPKDLSLTTLPLCSLSEQQEVVTILATQLSVLDQQEVGMAASLQRSEALRQSILKKAFSGQLVPQDPNDEPASVLLERIAKEKEQAAAKAKKSKKDKAPKKKAARRKAS